MKYANILGTKYEILKQSDEDNPKMKGCDGIYEPFSKKIIIRDFSKDFEDPKKAELAETEYVNKVIRHETVHAFFQESGLSNEAEFANDEILVDWIAMMGPKIFECWKSLNIM